MSKVKEIIASAPRDYPTLSLNAKELPAIKGWKVNKKYKLILDVELKNIGSDEWSEDNTIKGRFRVLKAKECDEDYE